MPRAHRIDYRGAWHHVMNRGIAKRVIFETEGEMRYFLSLLATEVRRGRLEVHAYCLMRTHFHLLVRSPLGQISDALRRVENAYVRAFNRRHRRDGPLFRSRFMSKLVECDRYLRVLVRYIDSNPVRARVVSEARDYRFCTAWHWATGRIPPWLSKAWIGQELGSRMWDAGSASIYRLAFGAALSSDQAEWIERRLRSRMSQAAPTDGLVDSDSEELRRWMQRKAELADGVQTHDPQVTVASARRSLERFGERARRCRIPRKRHASPALPALEAMVLRDLCGLSFREVARRIGTTEQTARRRYHTHRYSLSLLDYDSLATDLIRAILNDFHATLTGTVPGQKTVGNNG